MKRLIAFMLVALLALLVRPVGGQDVPATFCGDLSETDCQILTDSEEAMQVLESTTFSLEANIIVRNIPDQPFDELTFDLTGNGSFAADVASFDVLQPGDFLGEDVSFFPVIADVLRAVAADMTFTLELPEALVRLLARQEQLLPEQISLDLRMVEGVAYLNLEDIAPLARDGAIPAGWIGLDLAELYDTVLPGILEDMPSADTMNIVPMMTTLMQPENISRFVTIERLPDDEINGQAVAVFETRLDYVAMLEIPEFQAALLSTIGEAEAEEALHTIRAMYEGMTLVVTKSIGLDDRLVHTTEVRMDWDLSSLAETTDQEVSPSFSFNLMLTEESFNDAPEVVAPDEAFLLPIQQIIPSSTGSS